MQDLYNVNDHLVGRDGGPYLDEEEARLAEIRRAKVEGREPNLDNPPASAGIQLVTAAQALASRTLDINSIPSQEGNLHTSAEEVFKTSVKSDKTLLNVRAQRDLDALEAEEVPESKTDTAVSKDKLEPRSK
jgi:hypothetical protein